ncbi:hypothetical protein T492DRAFT_1013115 [Pavlovales sp. CCMP2436]|nr:hypothetical protein T492DRAFT_1013115 [Pavlovales sp. CCMP2436]
MRERLRAAEASTDPAAERGALLVLNEFVLSVANSTQSALGTLHSRQMDKVAALCTAAQRGGTPALHAAAYELFERGGLDADFVNWLALAIDAADAADGELPSQWQLVLRLIRQGTHAILQADYTQDIEVLRHVMSIPPAGRKDLLWTSLQEMNGESARHFEVTLRRIVGSLGLERDDKARVLHAEASELLVATEEWFDSPFYDGS